jgi:HEPN domain-containing protein
MSDADSPTGVTWHAWVRKAENDFLCISNNLSATHVPWDTVAFHAQQGVEKLLKVLLVHRGRQPARTHELVSLLALCAGFAPTLGAFEAECRELSMRAVRSRYPDDREETTEVDARALVASALRIRATVLTLLR